MPFPYRDATPAAQRPLSHIVKDEGGFPPRSGLCIAPDWGDRNMKLKSGNPYWPTKSAARVLSPPLVRDLECDVVVVGGGITGAMIARSLVREGLSTVIVDKRQFASGSTSASTALLQYELDHSLRELSTLLGWKHAAESYSAAAAALEELGAIVSELKDDCGFESKSSLYLASTPNEAIEFAKESDARRSIGLDCDFWNAARVEKELSIRRPAALFTPFAAQVDPMRLTIALLEDAKRSGLRAYEYSTVVGFDLERRDVATTKPIRLTLHTGSTIDAHQVVFATGYESQELMPLPLVRLCNTYSFVSRPIPNLPAWVGESVLWESRRPYLYVRSVEGNRVIAGGEDDTFVNVDRRDSSLERKTRRLVERVAELLPNCSIEAESQWSGTFAETQDSLPFLGAHPLAPNALFALCYGGNGIVFAVVAAAVIRDACCGRNNDSAALFAFDRAHSHGPQLTEDPSWLNAKFAETTMTRHSL